MTGNNNNNTINLIDANEAASICGKTRQTLYHYRRKGIGPRYYKIANRFYYKAEDLYAWIESSVVDPSVKI